MSLGCHSSGAKKPIIAVFILFSDTSDTSLPLSI
nr:MAG TPA: hypothetical protein [Caudoviricetes sp.]